MTTETPLRGEDELIDSASITALMRALLATENGLAQNPDCLAHYFLHGKWRSALERREETVDEYARKLPGCMFYHLVRTHAFDQVFKEYVARNAGSQIVILGAGYDSRGIRFKNDLKLQAVDVFEVDLAGMQKHKKSLIACAGLDDSAVRYAPCNFQKDSLTTSLINSGLEAFRPVLVLWEGVTYFLTEDQIDQSLADITHLSERPVDLILDYAFSDYVNGVSDFFGSKELKDILVEIAEPHHFGLNHNEVEQFFNARGYECVSNSTSMMLESRFIRDEFGRSAGLPHTFNGFAHLRTHAGHI